MELQCFSNFVAYRSTFYYNANMHQCVLFNLNSIWDKKKSATLPCSAENFSAVNNFSKNTCQKQLLS